MWNDDPMLRKHPREVLDAEAVAAYREVRNYLLHQELDLEIPESIFLGSEHLIGLVGTHAHLCTREVLAAACLVDAWLEYQVWKTVLQPNEQRRLALLNACQPGKKRKGAAPRRRQRGRLSYEDLAAIYGVKSPQVVEQRHLRLCEAEHGRTKDATAARSATPAGSTG
jgi:hypothetical protein